MAANVAGLKVAGFDLSRTEFGRLWGNGVYLALDRSTLNQYLSRLGDQAVDLEPRVNVDRILGIDLTKHLEIPTQRDIIAALPGDVDRYRRVKDEFDARNRRIRLRVDQELPPLPFSDRDSPVYQERERERERLGDALGIVRGSTITAAFTAVVIGAGYDALVIDDRFAVVGGRQMVVFDPRQVVIIDE